MTAPVVALLIALAGPADTTRLLPDSLPVPETVAVQVAQPAEDSLFDRIPTRLVIPTSLQFQPDTTAPRRRRKAVQVSDWYERRLRIHRYLAYTTIPLYAFQAIAGNQLFQESSGAPEWAKTGHRVGATALAAVFTVNTVTGVWNLWDSRSVSRGERAGRSTPSSCWPPTPGSRTPESSSPTTPRTASRSDASTGTSPTPRWEWRLLAPV